MAARLFVLTPGQQGQLRGSVTRAREDAAVQHRARTTVVISLPLLPQKPGRGSPRGRCSQGGNAAVARGFPHSQEKERSTLASPFSRPQWLPLAETSQKAAEKQSRGNAVCGLTPLQSRAEVDLQGPHPHSLPLPTPKWPSPPDLLFLTY